MEELHIFIHGVIGEGTVTAASISKRLTINKQAKDIVLHIDSVGGDVHEGFQIYDLLRLSGKKITAYVTGKCYSAAVCVLAAAVKGQRIALPSATFMIHKSWTTPSWVNSDMAAELAAELATIDKAYKGIVGRLMDVKSEEVLAMYDSETIFNAEKAKELGVVTQIQGQKEPAKAELTKEKIFACSQYLSTRMDNKKNAIEKLVAQALAKLGIKAEGGQPDDGGQGDGGTPQAASIGLQDGSATLYFEGDSLAEGSAVFTDEGMTTPAPDGDHLLADGSTITVVAGLVTTIVSAAAAIAALRQELADIKAQKDAEVAAKTTAEAAVVQAKKDLEGIRKALQNDGGKPAGGKPAGTEKPSDRDAFFTKLTGERK